MLAQGNEVGIGLRSPHLEDIGRVTNKPGWLEVHSENFMCGGEGSAKCLEELRKEYEISLHGVCLSLGSSSLPSRDHVERLQRLVKILNPCFVSDHVAWGNYKGKHMPDLLPLPYNDNSLDAICRNIGYVQDVLQRRILVENPSSYLQFNNSTMSESEFLCQMVKRSGCMLLLDINNIYVNAVNHGIDALEYIRSIPSHYIGEVHLSGHTYVDLSDGNHIIIDTHGERVSDEVWRLYEQFLNCHGVKPTLVEWDKDVPDISVLLEEMDKARQLVSCHGGVLVDVRSGAYA